MRTLFYIVFFSIFQVIAFSLTVQAQVKGSEPPLVIIAKASGEIFLEKNKPEFKPTFTEVDVSQYAAGILYAELKLSSGGCDAMLITTLAPTEGRNSRQFIVGTGKTAIEKLKALTISDGVVRNYGKTSPKFYVSADITDRGISAWYEKDCRGTYEINVYIQSGKKVCGTFPPIPSNLNRNITRLNALTRYSERKEVYNQIHNELHRRGLGLGFFEAASTVMDNFSYDPWSFEEKTQDFLDSLSKELAAINAKYAAELLQTGKLEKENKNGYFIEPVAIDNELIRREQVFAGKKLSNLSQSGQIIADINRNTKSILDDDSFTLFKKLDKFNSLISTNEVRNQKRKRNPNAEFDYGDINDRINVGRILAAKYRNNNLPNAVQCK